jgi:hypothetical protein
VTDGGTAGSNDDEEEEEDKFQLTGRELAIVDETVAQK